MEKENKIEKIKQIDDTFKPLFEEVGLDIQSYKIFKVKGDGACGSNCAALACHHDERLGQYVRRNINDYKVKHWSYFKDSMVFPHRQMLGHQEITFENENKYLEFLKDNCNSGRLWMDHTDLQALSNYYQINIHILTTNVKNMVNAKPRWTHMEPDIRMKKFSPVPQGLPEMWLMHLDEIHFDLIVHKDSLLATEGSIDMERKEESEKGEKSSETDRGLKQSVAQRHEDEDVYRCILCKKVFKTEKGLKNHMFKYHGEDKGVECKVCERILETEEILNVPMKNEHKETHLNEDHETGPGYMGWKINEEDGNIEKDENIWKAVSDLKKDVKALESKLSSVVTEYKHCVDALKEETHARSKAEETTKILKRILESKEELDKRNTEEHIPNGDEDMEIDDTTGVWIQQQKRKSIRIKKTKSQQEDRFNHDKSNTYSRQECKKTFDGQKVLEKQEQSHSLSSTYSCDKCNESYDDKSVLETHKETHSQDYYKCEHCEIRLSDKNLLEEHEINHKKIVSVEM